LIPFVDASGARADMRAIPRRRFQRVAAGLVSASLLAAPAMAAKSAPIPDFSGIWGRNWLYFEPPPSGPGPIVSKLKRPNGTMDVGSATVGDDGAAILKPAAAEAVRKSGKIALGGEDYPNPHNQCSPEPTPFTVAMQFGMQMLQRRDEIVILYVGDHKVRHVRMNAAHPAHPVPTWQGDSVGHYEGDTLVIDTVGQKVGPLSMVDQYGTPFSRELHVVERYRLIDGAAARDAQRKHEGDYFPPGVSSPLTNAYGRGDIDPGTGKKGLQVEVTVEDPVMFTTPWKALVTYRHVLGEWPEAVCAENTREYYANRNTRVPEARRPDF
jgi:hypothetical protein